MIKVFTSVDSATLEKIKRSSKSTYAFLKEAVELKLENDTVLDMETVIERKFEKEFAKIAKKIREENQDMIEQSFGEVIHLFSNLNKSFKELEEQKKLSEESFEFFKKGLRSTMEKMFDEIKSIKNQGVR